MMLFGRKLPWYKGSGKLPVNQKGIFWFRLFDDVFRKYEIMSQLILIEKRPLKPTDACRGMKGALPVLRQICGVLYAKRQLHTFI